MSDSMASVEKKDHVKRLFSEEKGLHSVVFQNRDDTTTEYIFSRPVKYVDENGNIRDKSTDISVNSDNSGFSAADNTVRSYFSGSISDGICITFGEYNVEFYPSLYESKGSILVNADLSGDLASRERVAYVISPEAVIYYTPTLEGLKEDIVLDFYAGENSFEFTYMTDGLSMTVNAYGEVELKNEGGNTVGKLNRIVCYDSNGKISVGSVSVTEITPNVEYTVMVTADVDFLTSPTTVYPISIDPSIQLEVNDSNTGDTHRLIEDIWLYNNQETLDYIYNRRYLPIGPGDYEVGGDKSRMVYRFTEEFYTLESYADLIYGLEHNDVYSATLMIPTRTWELSEDIRASVWNGVWPEGEADPDDPDGCTYMVYCTDSTVFDAYNDTYSNDTTVSEEYEGNKAYNITAALKQYFVGYSNGTHTVTGIMLRNTRETDCDGAGIYFTMARELYPYEYQDIAIAVDYAKYKPNGNYIMTRETGKFLNYDGMDPCISTYSSASSTYWGLEYLGNGEYHIVCDDEYLTASGSEVIMTLKNLSNLNPQKWKIEEEINSTTHQISHISIKNVSTGTYLTETAIGISLRTANSPNDAFSWVVCHNSDYVAIMDFNLEDDWIPINKEIPLKLDISPGNVTDWGGAKTFTWSISSSYIQFTSTPGTIASSATPGTATVTVTHTPTGITKTFRIYRGAVREGTYMIRNRESRKYMNVINASEEDWTRTAQYAYHTEGHAKWNISMLTNGDYVLQADHSGKYLRVANAPTIVTNIVQFSDYTPSSTRWQIYSTSSGAFRIVPKDNTSFALTLPNDGTQYNNGTCIIQNTYTNDTNYIDEWYIDAASQTHGIVDGRVYNIMVNNGGNKYLTVAGEGTPTASGGGLADGSNVMQYAIEKGEHQWQRWQMIYVNDGLYKIKDMNSGKLLTVKDDSYLIQANIQIETDTNSSGQLFKIRENTDKSYSFLTKCSDFTMVLDINNYSQQNGANLEQYHDNGTINQKFVLEESNKAIIIIPGILGSELFIRVSESDDFQINDLFFNDGDPVFAAEAFNNLAKLIPIHSALKCDEFGDSQYNLYVKEFRREIPAASNAENIYSSQYGMANQYEGVYNAFTNDNEINDNYIVDFFSYDWRLSNGISAQKLDEYIERYGYDEVVLVAHSMGGLVASGYLGLGAKQRDKVDKVFYLASPLLGAPEIANVWYNEDLSFVEEPITKMLGISSTFFQVIMASITTIANPIQNLISNYISIYELFPSEYYFQLTNSSYMSMSCSCAGADQKNELNTYIDTVEALELFPKFDSKLMDIAEGFHDSTFISGNHISSYVDSYYFYGTRSSMTTAHVNLYQTDDSDGYSLSIDEKVIGDSLVTVTSATLYNSNYNKSQNFNSNHMGILSADVISKIISILLS